MIILDVKPNTEEWLIFRRTHIGGSDSPSICGVDPYTKPEKLWSRKFCGEKVWCSPAMDRGKKLEPVARERVSHLMGYPYLEYVVQSGEHPWMIASLDGFSLQHMDGIEIKCPSEKTFNKIVNDEEIPLSYIYQINHQMIVTECSSWNLVVFNGSYLEIERIERDESICKEIIEKGERFYNSLLNGEFIP